MFDAEPLCVVAMVVHGLRKLSITVQYVSLKKNEKDEKW